MTIGRSLSYVEMDVPLTRQTVFGQSRVNGRNNANTVSLMNFEGTNGSTVMHDTALGHPGRAWTPTNATLTTTLPLSGVSSLTLAGTGHIRTPHTADLDIGTRPFTIHTFFEVTVAAGSYEALAGKCNGAGFNAANRSWLLLRNSGSGEPAALVFQVSDGVSLFTIVGTTLFTNVLNTGRNHVAITRGEDGIIRMFINGQLEGTPLSFPGAIHNVAGSLGIGSVGDEGFNFWNGKVDAFQFIIGEALWTSEFTPPTTEPGVTEATDWTEQWNPSTLFGIEDENFPSGRGVRLQKDIQSGRTAWSFNEVPTIGDVSILSYQRPRGASTQPQVIARGSGGIGTEQGYRCAIRPDLGSIDVAKWTAGTFALLASTPFTMVVDDYYWIRFEVFSTSTGVTLRGKVWQGTLADEPFDWMVSFEDTSDFPDGWSGIFSSNITHELDVGFWYMQSLGDEEDTCRFSIPTEYSPPDIDHIPSIVSIGHNPATVSLGEDLGRRATVTVSFRDHPHMFYDEAYDVGTYWGKFRARHGTKLRGRSFRLIRGLLGQPLENMETRHFVVETTDGPTPDGRYQIVAQDPLKFLDDSRAQAPILSEGKLSAPIDDNDLSATLSPTGVGATYPASGHICFGGKEIASFTRSGDVLTIVRGLLGTEAVAHDTGDRAQLVLYYPGDDAADIVFDLITNYTDFDPTFIVLADWLLETEANLPVLYARAITEPTGVNKLLAELIEQAALALAWDDLASTLRLQVLRAIATSAQVISEETIVEGSLRVVEQPDQRISQHWTWFGQRDPTDRGDNSDNYRASLAEVDLERETDYGSPEIRKLFGNWIPTETAADRLNQIKLSRFRDPPRRFNFDLWQGNFISILGGYRLQWRQFQDLLGGIVGEGAPIQVTRISTEPGLIHIEAEEMLASGSIVLSHIVILIDPDVGTWDVPSDWNDANNFVATIGAGGGGGGGTFTQGGGGGGGGAYARKNNLNLTPSASIAVQIGVGGNGGGVLLNGAAGTDSWFNGTSLVDAETGAAGGAAGISSSGAGGLGGAAGASVGDLRTSGGDGGQGSPKGSNHAGGGGGGGAAGPNGDGARGGRYTGGRFDVGAGGGGADGGSAPSDDTALVNLGGNNRFNFGGGTDANPDGLEGGGGVGGVNAAPGNGGDGEQIWTQTISPIFSVGPGGGAGGGGRGTPSGGTGGDFGGGGGGGGVTGSGGTGNPGGPGADGAIIISWTP